MSEDFYTYHLTFGEEDGSDPIVTRFAPCEETERVIFSNPRFAAVNEDNEEFEWFRTFDEANDWIDNHDGDEDLHVLDAFEQDSRPDWFYDGGFGAKWHSTDAWRGYTVPVYDVDVWEPFASGWVTGYPDESTAHKMTAADLHNGLYNNDLTPPFEIVWFFGVTSNVFSQVSDILIPVGKADEFEAWLQSVDYNPEAVQRAFN